MTKHLWKDGIRGGDWAPSQILSGGHGNDNLQWRHDWTGHGKSTAAPSSLCLMELWVQSMQLIHDDIAFCLNHTEQKNGAVKYIYRHIYYTYIYIYDNGRLEQTKAIICNPKHIFSSATTRTILNVESISCNRCDQITLHPFCRRLFAGHMCSKWFY